MALRFFADHCVPTSVIHGLQEDGHTVFRLRDHLPIASPDEVVISYTQQLDALLISLNGDFSDIVGYPPAQYKGIIALQVKTHPEMIPHVSRKSYIESDWLLINKVQARPRKAPSKPGPDFEGSGCQPLSS